MTRHAENTMITAGRFSNSDCDSRASRNRAFALGLLSLLFFCLVFSSSLLWSQGRADTSTAVSAASSNAQQNPPEITSREETPTFKVKVNLVEVRLVVRDAKGQAIGNLRQDDFQLFDNGKPQVTSKFGVEKAGATPIVQDETATTPGMGKPGSLPAATAAIMPQRFVAYLFDDVHLNEHDLQLARAAAKQQLQALQPGDRVSIDTTSGQTVLDFTDERAQLVAALNRIIPRPLTRPTGTPCPDISYYMADLIHNKRDQQAIAIATQDALDCAFSGDPQMYNSALRMVDLGALEQLHRNEDETRISLSVLKNLVRRIDAMPGERTIVFVSPGFLNPDDLSEEAQLMEQALHSKVVINSLDARGLYVDLPEISDERSPRPKVAGMIQQYRSQELAADDDILADLAYTTGGSFFHNSNDLNEGFRRLAGAPEYSYLLGFAPQNLKLDGRYHKIKVELKAPARGTVQARRGYYAPKGPSDASEQARQEIEDAVFSRDEVRDIPIELHTQFFKPDNDNAKLSVVARVDVRHMHYYKGNGRNNNDVTIVSAVFDRNGNFISGSQKLVQLHLKDETLEGRLGSGITLKSSFDVKPGSYLVRLVVRGQDGQLASQNSAVEIP